MSDATFLALHFTNTKSLYKCDKITLFGILFLSNNAMIV